MVDSISTKEFPGKLDFPLLQDLDHKVIDAYGLYNPLEEDVKPGIPYRAVYILNKEGVVTKRIQHPSGEHATNEEIREELKRIGAVQELSGPRPPVAEIKKEAKTNKPDKSKVK